VNGHIHTYCIYVHVTTTSLLFAVVVVASCPCASYSQVATAPTSVGQRMAWSWLSFHCSFQWIERDRDGFFLLFGTPRLLTLSIQPVRLLVSASPNQPANSVFLSQQTSTRQPKPTQKQTSERAVCTRNWERRRGSHVKFLGSSSQRTYPTACFFLFSVEHILILDCWQKGTWLTPYVQKFS